MENYLKILETSLQKKNSVLDEISKYSDAQSKLFDTDDVDLEKFDEYVEKKDELIEKLEQLDNGFESLYARVGEQLKDNHTLYAEQIRSLQALVKEVTDKSVSIQAQEARNKAFVEEYFRKRRSEIGKNRRSANSAYKYYQSLSGANAVQSSIMDSKQ